MRLSVTLLLLASFAISLVSADHHGSKRNHAAVGVSRRQETELSVFKRGGGAAFTYYQAGVGACGKTNKPSDFIVALDSQQFNGGAHCFEMITITVGGKSNQAMIVDECMACGENNLDLSQGLFDSFGSEDAGILHGSWTFGGGDSKPSPSPTPKAKSSPKASPKPSSSKATHTSTKAKPSTFSTSTKQSTTHTPTPTPSATPSSVAPNVDVQTAGALASQEANTSNVYAINMAFMGLCGLVANA